MIEDAWDEESTSEYPTLATARVLVAEDDPELRELVASRLRRDGCDVVEVTNGDDALDRIVGLTTTGLELAILDVRMPGMSGLELQEQLVARGVNLPILFITGHGDVPMAVATMKKGAVDFIEKPFNEADLRAAVERMLAAAEDEAETRRREREREDLLSRLTARERQVLECIVAGRLNKQIADDLGISIKTVEAHRANIMDKLNAGTVADLLRLALTRG
jgi:RNA polymerase sigma factor (sigma-70 family)